MTRCACTRSQPCAELQRLRAERDRLCELIRWQPWGSLERRLAIVAYTEAVERVRAHEQAARAAAGTRVPPGGGE